MLPSQIKQQQGHILLPNWQCREMIHMCTILVGFEAKLSRPNLTKSIDLEELLNISKCF